MAKAVYTMVILEKKGEYLNSPVILTPMFPSLKSCKGNNTCE